jgi:tRNA pseudouridine38-40 synthase
MHRVLILLCLTMSAVNPLKLCRYRARLMYDGTGYFGFQEQQRARSVQGCLNEVLSKKFNMPVRTTGASRTDTGVHARGNCIHFDAHPMESGSLQQQEYKINQLLPNDIRIYSLASLPPTSLNGFPFHAITCANGKLYSYSFSTNTAMDPLRARYCAHLYQKFDMGLFEQSLQQFVGTHDFISFANKVANTRAMYEQLGVALNTTRTVHNITLHDQGEGYFRIDVHVQTALNRMLRNIVGSSLRVAEGKMSLTELQALLTEKSGLLAIERYPHRHRDWCWRKCSTMTIDRG